MEKDHTHLVSQSGEQKPAEGEASSRCENLWLYPKSARDRLSNDFHLGEFRCRCHSNRCHMTLVHPQLAVCLQTLRDLLARPLILTSAFRCNSYNRIIGGRPRSYHTRGMAADILCQDLEQLEELAQAAAGIPAIGGLGRYPLRRFVHIDVRQRRDDAIPVAWSE